jgi:hypothetical protein
MNALEQTLNALPAADRARFEALAPYVGSASQSAVDRAWLHSLAERHPALADELLYQAGLRQLVQSQARFAQVPDDVGLDRALTQIRALHKPAAGHPAPTDRQASWWDTLTGWLQPSPAWAMAVAVALIPASFLVGRETAPPPYADVRGTAPGLFDGPLLRVSFQPQTPEQTMREVLIAQGALGVGPTRLGDWYLKVAPERVEAVRDALGKQPAVATVDVAPSLPSELVDQP